MTLSSIFFGQAKQNRANSNVSNIVKAKEMSLKPFRDKKNLNYYRSMQKASVSHGRKKP
jgi:hypothetical protein